jgi:hypothetical protein
MKDSCRAVKAKRIRTHFNFRFEINSRSRLRQSGTRFARFLAWGLKAHDPTNISFLRRPDAIPTTSSLAAEVVDEPHQQREDDAEDYAGDHREINLRGARAVAPGEVSWETSDGDVEASEDEDDGSGDQKQESESDQDFAEVIHSFIG